MKKEQLEQKLISTGKKEPFIGSFAEACDFQKIGSYLETGYRINFCTHVQARNSLFLLHNDTLNIWTHFIGSLYYMVMLASVV